jgi:hypothetical protein
MYISAENEVTTRLSSQLVYDTVCDVRKRIPVRGDNSGTLQCDTIGWLPDNFWCEVLFDISDSPNVLRSNCVASSLPQCGLALRYVTSSRKHLTKFTRFDSMYVKRLATCKSVTVSYGCETWPITVGEEHRLIL